MAEDGEFLARYRREHNLHTNGPEFFIDLPPNSKVNSNDLQAVQNSFVTVGDVAATMQMVTQLNSLHKRFILRSAADVSLGDLRNTPTVLIGGFNNRWTLEVIGSGSV